MTEPVPDLSAYKRVVIFPGKFDGSALSHHFAPDTSFAFDIAYDIGDLSSLSAFRERTSAVVISTSSDLFIKLGHESLDKLVAEVKTLHPEVFLLKENRGGSRLFHLGDGSIDEIPATLGDTKNSVGVGDVYTAVMAAMSHKGWREAAWRGCQAATAYSQSTYPDDIRREVLRSFKVTVDELRELGGTMLPWHDRQQFSIYLAGPDFSYTEKPELDRAVDSLQYHNFKVRRPIQENGEIKRPGSAAELIRTYHQDCQLLKECDVVFAIPLNRDPGTLVEVGMAIAMGKPVITYDPRGENDNTMVMAGSVVYSGVLEECLNGIFNALSKLRVQSK